MEYLTVGVLRAFLRDKPSDMAVVVDARDGSDDLVDVSSRLRVARDAGETEDDVLVLAVQRETELT